MAQGRSTKIITMIKWIRTSRLSRKNSRSLCPAGGSDRTSATLEISSTELRGEDDQREFFIDNLLVRIHLIIVMIRWTGLAPCAFEFPVPGSLVSTFLEPHGQQRHPRDLLHGPARGGERVQGSGLRSEGWGVGG